MNDSICVTEAKLI